MSEKRWFVSLSLTILATVTLLVTGAWAAPHETVLHRFHPGGGGTDPSALIFDTAGNLYGTMPGQQSIDGCFGDCGRVFELTRNASGGWTEKVLHRFNGSDGNEPIASLVMDADGNLYGTTVWGGRTAKECRGGCGLVFELSPHAGGAWTERVIHHFHGRDGEGPGASLLLDASGNLYGTTPGGGVFGSGVAFKLTRKAGGWTEEVLHHFHDKDGINPWAGLISDGSGNLYGTTSQGGLFHSGTVFKLMPKVNGGWTEKVLHHFAPNGRDGMDPLAGVIIDASGNLYGTTFGGGSFDAGTVFELMPKANGGWTEKVLHDFAPNGRDGVAPNAGVIIDTSGNLYGTTQGGGLFFFGTVFELTPHAGGVWTQKLLHDFHGRDGAGPYTGLTFDDAGNLYGTTQGGGGGSCSCGVVFKITL
jgi:uncharacterized repeat protein (TIGR03803 family)